jgi:hypothetical protein
MGSRHVVYGVLAIALPSEAQEARTERADEAGIR